MCKQNSPLALCILFSKHQTQRGPSGPVRSALDCLQSSPPFFYRVMGLTPLQNPGKKANSIISSLPQRVDDMTPFHPHPRQEVKQRLLGQKAELFLQDLCLHCCPSNSRLIFLLLCPHGLVLHYMQAWQLTRALLLCNTKSQDYFAQNEIRA